MNLLDTASLVVTPNGYKASKLYSIVPSDGTGDMTFARTGDTATRVNSSGLIESVLANKPRLDYLGSTCPKLLLEPQRTNVILQSQDISSASWSKNGSPTIVANASVAPDGTTTADTITADGTTSDQLVFQDLTVSANSTYTFSVFVKKATTKTYFGGLRIYLYNGTAKNVLVAFDEVNGTLTNLPGNSLTPTLKVDDYGTYYRFNVTVTDTGSNTTIRPLIYGVISKNGTTVDTSGAGSARTIWGAQLEAGAYATSYIPTTTASVTRNKDNCLTASVTSLVGQTEGTMFFTVQRTSLSETIFIMLSNLAGTTSNSYMNSVYFYQLPNDAALFEGYVSNVLQFRFTATALSIGTHKIAIAYKSNDFIAYINGVQVGVDTSGSVPAMNFLTLGGSVDVSNHSQKISSSALWKTRLQNSELATLTSL